MSPKLKSFSGLGPFPLALPQASREGAASALHKDLCLHMETSGEAWALVPTSQRTF